MSTPNTVVTLESALKALAHLEQSNADGRMAEARAMLEQAQPVSSQPELEVRIDAMPETNGKKNWTVRLVRKDRTGLRGDIATGVTFGRSEYHDRERYAADRLRFLLGQLDQQPYILDYDADLKDPLTPETGAPVTARAVVASPRLATVEAAAETFMATLKDFSTALEHEIEDHRKRKLDDAHPAAIALTSEVELADDAIGWGSRSLTDAWVRLRRARTGFLG